MLNIFYINLDDATERRIALEECLNQFSSSDIQCHRISAYSKEYVEKIKSRERLGVARRVAF